MATHLFSAFALAAGVALLTACAGAPPAAPEVVAPAQEPAAPEAAPELTLNLPLNLPTPQRCDCIAAVSADYTFLEKGFTALAAGEHIEAVQYFQSYQRLESSARADWEAGIAIAYDSMLPQSPFYDPDAARLSYARLGKQYPHGQPVHEMALIMRNSLDTLVSLGHKLDSLKSDNVELREDLRKREEAIKRLRELTLGQRGSEQ